MVALKVTESVTFKAIPRVCTPLRSDAYICLASLRAAALLALLDPGNASASSSLGAHWYGGSLVRGPVDAWLRRRAADGLVVLAAAVVSCMQVPCRTGHRYVPPCSRSRRMCMHVMTYCMYLWPRPAVPPSTTGHFACPR